MKILGKVRFHICGVCGTSNRNWWLNAVGKESFEGAIKQKKKRRHRGTRNSDCWRFLGSILQPEVG